METTLTTTQFELVLIPHAYEGELINQRRSDGYINATALCRAAGREWSTYRRGKAAEGFFEELALGLQISQAQLAITIMGTPGGDPRNQGTWVHPQVAIHHAQWLSPKFAVLVSQWVLDWMSTGTKPADLPWQQFHDRVSLNFDSVPDGYFSVFKECAQLYATLLSAGVNPGVRMILDISAGLHWGNHWRANRLEDQFGKRIEYPHDYPHYFPQSASNPQRANAYPDLALPTFRSWLGSVYTRDKLAQYLQDQVRQGKIANDAAESVVHALRDRRPVVRQLGPRKQKR